MRHIPKKSPKESMESYGQRLRANANRYNKIPIPNREKEKDDNSFSNSTQQGEIVYHMK